MPDLAFPDQVPDRPGRILDWHVRVDAVLIEEIDAVGFEPLERGLGNLPDALRPAVQPGGGVAILEAKLRGDHDLVAERSQGFADKFLVRERAVGLRGVEEGYAALDGRPDQRNSAFLVYGRTVAEAQPHAAKSNGRDF